MSKVDQMSDDEFIEYLNGLVDSDISEFNATVKQLRENALKVKIKFLATEPFQITEQPNYLNANSLLNTYSNLCFFPSKEISAKFEEFGIQKKDLNWFVAIEDIITELNSIKNAGILAFPNKVIEGINVYLISKINFDVHIWAGEYSENKWGHKKIKLVSEMEKVYDRMYYNGGEVKKVTGKVDQFLTEVIKEFSDLESELTYEKKSILKLFKSQNPKFFFIDFLRNCFIYDRKAYNHDYFLSSLYNLFKLFVKDALPTPKEMEDSIRYSGKSRQGWQAHVLRIFIFKNSKKVFP